MCVCVILCVSCVVCMLWVRVHVCQLRAASQNSRNSSSPPPSPLLSSPHASCPLTLGRSLWWVLKVSLSFLISITFGCLFDHVGSKVALQPLALHHVAAFPDILIYLHFLWITPLMVTVEAVTFFSSCGVKSAVISLFLSPFSLPSSFTSSAVFSRTCFLPASISFPSFLPFVSGRLLDAQMRSRAQCTLRTRYGVTVRCLIRHQSHILWFCLRYVLLQQRQLSFLRH